MSEISAKYSNPALFFFVSPSPVMVSLQLPKESSNSLPQSISSMIGYQESPKESNIQFV